MLFQVLNYIKLIGLQKKWRAKNKHNQTKMEKIFPIEKVKVGRNTYGSLNIFWMYSGEAKIEIGNYCSIAPKVEFLIGGQHDYRRISTYPFQSKIYKQESKDKKELSIIVEDDVWIGMETLIMSGVRIGKGSVIGARSIVTKDIPPFSIYIGNSVVRKRFHDNIIDQIKDIDYSKICHWKNDEYEQYCQSILTEKNVEIIKNKFETK